MRPGPGPTRTPDGPVRSVRCVDSVIRSWPGRPEPDRDEELRRTELAVRQLERAELYVVSAINLDLPSWEQRQALHNLRCELLEVCSLLRRPRPLG